MNLIKHSRTFALAALGLFAGTASAHTGDHAVTGFVSGLAHPLLGLDHLFAMVAIGLWAAQQGGRALWAVPAAFVGAMLVGGGLAWSGIALPQVETALALSVLVLGLLIASRRQWAVTAAMALAAGFAVFHGYAHGLEMPLAASPALYGLGFVLATLGLHGLGIVGRVIGRRTVQLAGAGIAATGLALIFAM
ncbi:MAG: HupE/UreJ family protein [Thiobacillus sp.]|uniref:HupE/UreJ family protein n=1 Tax=Thiobacillus sp. TaxID=924 RepID=UPI002732E450|nr:HupE/UreJ family protein [Thiobacillus sp.]MDP3586154.1 HupE/UreJ family protein [Thiobacillus sp.]